MENFDSIVEISHVGVQENPDDDKGTFYIHGNYDQPGSKVSMAFITIQINQSDSLFYRPMICYN